ncbi:DUF1440 domain-containing protein [Deinococcus metallilatus]|uniref:DUF1440 domain-containing protein n=1 Tax=Deinococcus metallilatus TaxID=1211322 RepID=A0AAJ5F345_9DEIO|nr:DUF1440 domain-containing protein [Deinococcus metallilatus]MBB5295557.1 putative membrane protein [Deinococcus metallilatus]QBY07929.1 DUF1440 domain-containing protein [Deinococcus metallilatus]RXJ12822.1 DUF1440 domain-containing protein [Deinococcus metallilatus]TLK27256.1 DUF1440 domain-containing protein [Deinococcus metallilatus]
MNPFLKSALAGCAATLPMSVWMLAAQHFLLPRRERYPLPPEQITEHAAEAAGLDAVAENEPVLKAATVLNHFAYGAATGALYAPLRELPGSPVLKGMGLGLGVWTGSYLGLLPATGLLSSATEHPARRNALMIAAHLIWGGCTGVLAERKG